MSMDLTRRSLAQTATTALLLSALRVPNAWAKSRPPKPLDAWARRLVELKDDLQTGRIDVLQWQERVERLNTSVPVADLTRYLDVDAVTKDFAYQSNLAEAKDPILPAEITGELGMRRWFVRVFGLRRGGAVIPHVHNNMVSAHLAIGGRFRVRTHDRLRDVDGAVLLRPTIDDDIGVGEIISMSDRRNNQHWLIAQEDRSLTLDVGVVGLAPSWAYGHQAKSYNMIFVDPTVRPQSDGTLVAPILTWDEASAKFAA